MASGFAVLDVGTPSVLLSQRATGFVTPGTAEGAPVPVIASSAFDTDAVGSSFGAYSWAVTAGAIADGKLGNEVPHWSAEASVGGLSMATTGSFSVVATVVIQDTGTISNGSMIYVTLGPGIEVGYFRNWLPEGNDNSETYVVGASPDYFLSWITPFVVGSTHVFRFEVTPTQTRVYVDDVLLRTAPVSHAVTTITSIDLTVRGLYLDSLVITDAGVAVTPETVWLPRTVVSSTFDSESVVSDFGTHAWALSSGAIADGKFGDTSNFVWCDAAVNGLSAATSGYYSVIATVIAQTNTRPNTSFNSAVDVFINPGLQLSHGRNGYESWAGDNDAIYIAGVEEDYFDSWHAPYVDGSTHVVRFEVEPTQTKTYVDDVLLRTSPVSHTATAVTSVGLSVRGLLVDSLVVLDAHGETAPAESSSSAANAVLAQPAFGFAPVLLGTPSAPSLQALDVSGWQSFTSGLPYTPAPFALPGVNLSLSATSTYSTAFGTPTAGGRFVQAVGAAPNTAAGMPTSARAQRVSLLASTLFFGQPDSQRGTSSAGFRSTALGVPDSSRTQFAGSTYRAVRWGSARAVRSNVFAARPFNNALRFGRPVAFGLNAHGADGLASAAQFGAPACTQRYRARHYAPEARFGKPLMIRNPPC